MTHDEKVFLDLSADRQKWQLLLAIQSVATALANAPAVQYLSAITGFTGGTSSKLDSVATIGLPTGRSVQFEHATLGLKQFVLLASTVAADNVDFIIVHPTDYNASTNAKVWSMVS